MKNISKTKTKLGLKIAKNITLTGAIFGALFCLSSLKNKSVPKAQFRQSYNFKETAVSFELTASQDNRAVRLNKYLEGKNSPLAEHTDLLVKKADENDLDWRLLTAISGIESSFGKAQLDGSNNAWGWGGGYIYFDSWGEAITKVSNSLGERWAKKGGRDHWQLSKSYCPPNWYNWSMAVEKFMKEISKTQV